MIFRIHLDNIHALETSLFSTKLGIAGTVDCIAEYNGELAGGNLTGPLNKNFDDFEDDDCNLEDEDENLDEDDFLNESSPAKFCNDSYNSYVNMPNGNDRLSSHY